MRTLSVDILQFGYSSSLTVRDEITVDGAGRTVSSLSWRSFVEIVLRQNATLILSRSGNLHVVLSRIALARRSSSPSSDRGTTMPRPFSVKNLSTS